MFYVLESDNMCAVGKVRSPSEDPLLVQQIIHEKQNSILENEFSLDANDIYKDLGIMGYDYRREFQSLKSIRTNDFQDFYGICKWTGNVITFLDGLLQSMIFATPFRKLMVPVMVRVLRIEPKVLFDGAKHYKLIDVDREGFTEESRIFGAKLNTDILNASETTINEMYDRFCFFESEIPFYFNSNSKLLVTHGVEIENVMAFPIQRKVDSVLDSYEFVLNEDNCAIEKYERKKINEYLEVIFFGKFNYFKTKKHPSQVGSVLCKLYMVLLM